MTRCISTLDVRHGDMTASTSERRKKSNVWIGPREAWAGRLNEFTNPVTIAWALFT